MNKYIKPNLLYLFLPVAVLPDFVIEFIGSILGTFGYLLIRKRRKTAILNACFVTRNNFDKKTARKIARKSFKNFATSILYAIKFYFRSESYLKKRVRIDNSRYKLSDLNGGIALFAHLGNWELIPQIAKHLHIKGAVIYRPIDNHFADSMMKLIRKKGKIALIPKIGAVSRSIELLNEGFFVGIDGDQNVAKKEGIETDFLGVKAYTSKLPAVLAIRSQKKIYPIFLISEAPGRYRFVVEKEIGAPKDACNSLAMKIITEKINQVIGKYVIDFPDQWLLMHRRWKNRENELEMIIKNVSKR